MQITLPIHSLNTNIIIGISYKAAVFPLEIDLARALFFLFFFVFLQKLIYQFLPLTKMNAANFYDNNNTIFSFP